jgi:UPF0042 nucleotide-binding protein
MHDPEELMGTARRILLVSGLSGAGKSSILRVLEDLGHEAVDNPPLAMLTGIVQRSEGPLAIGVDVRTTGFDAVAVLDALAGLRRDLSLHPELLFAVAEEAVLLRRYTATRRRHPLARGGSVSDGIAAEVVLTAPLRANADLVIDTSELRPSELRRLVEARYAEGTEEGENSLTVSLVSFAFPAGLPRESDMVFDARFLRNPFYDPILSSMTGLDRSVVAHIEADPDYRPFLDRIHDLLRLVLPRFVTEGKKYATIAVGCSGGRHRSVALVEALSRRLGNEPPPDGQDENELSVRDEPLHYVRYPIIVMHRELSRAGRPQ